MGVLFGLIIQLCQLGQNTIEPRDTYCNSQSRPDIAIQNVVDFNVELDISIAHPWSSDILPSAAQASGVAALRREKKKKEKYGTETHPGGFSPKLIPLVLEHFGFWGQEGQRFLHEISQRSRDEDGKANSIEFKTYWRRLFSMTLQRCNASVINRKLDRLSYSTASVGNLYRNQMYSRYRTVAY